MRHIHDVRYRRENFTTILCKEIVFSTKYSLATHIVEFLCLFRIMCVYIHNVVESQTLI